MNNYNVFIWYCFNAYAIIFVEYSASRMYIYIYINIIYQLLIQIFSFYCYRLGTDIIILFVNHLCSVSWRIISIYYNNVFINLHINKHFFFSIFLMHRYAIMSIFIFLVGAQYHLINWTQWSLFTGSNYNVPLRRDN